MGESSKEGGEGKLSGARVAVKFEDRVVVVGAGYSASERKIIFSVSEGVVGVGEGVLVLVCWDAGDGVE